MINGNSKFRLFGALFIAAFVALGAAITYPIYQVGYFFVTIGSAVALGAAIALLATRLKWSAVTVSLAALLTFAVLGLPLTNPAALSSLQNIGAGWLETVTSLFRGWKQLVTIELPVGDYHALLAPAFIVFFVSTLLATLFIFAKPQWFWAATFPFMSMTIFGIAFGRTTVAGDVAILDSDISISMALLAGFVLLALGIAYLSWGSNAVRRGNQIAINEATNVGRLAPLLRYLRRFGSAIGVVTLAVLVASLSISAAGVPSTRKVIRSAVEPLLRIQAQISPLSTYRQFLSDPALSDAKVLSFTSSGNTPDRIRLQVMPYFDGSTFRVTPTDGSYDANSVFTRTPSNLASQTGSSQTTATTFTMGNYDGIWVPMVGNVKNVSFTGVGATTLADSFYMNRNTFSGALVPGPSAKATYVVESYLDENPVALSDIVSNDGSNIDTENLPESITTWISAQNVTVQTASDLEILVKKLRARGYLSHSLEKPTGAKSWMAQIDGFGSFEPSLAGHSIARIDDLFKALNARQQGEKSTNDKDLVAAPGDDEQFVTAAALLAAKSGFAVRVVVGFRTIAPVESAYSVDPCDKGVCLGRNLTAWLEVSGGDGRWGEIDVTPQYKNPISIKTDNTKPPQNATDVDEENAGVVPPGPSSPKDCVPTEGQTTCDDADTGLDLTWLWSLLGTVISDAFVVAFIASPFALIVGTKIRRRRARKNSNDPAYVVVSAWDEYVDNQVDYGKPIPKAQTRSEIADLYGSDAAYTLATLSDEAAFAAYDPSDEIIAEAWQIVDAEAAARKSESKLWKQGLAWLSLRSFLRYVKPEEQITKLRGALSFSSGQTEFQGSTLKALIAVAKRQAPVIYGFGKTKSIELYGKARSKLTRLK